jgi:DNA-binding response OmpR family regulator/nitrogen-specific signal transduction histidine kinase/DNA-binding CsgD family transcriptional regulator
MSQPDHDRAGANVSVVSGEHANDPIAQDHAALVQTCADLGRAKAVAEAANEAKSRYLVSVGHEIRSPLNAIYGYAQLLERGDDLSPNEAGAVIRRSAEHLTNLVESLLEISRIESGVLTISSDVVDVRVLLGQVADMFRVQAQAKQLYLRLQIDARLPRFVKTDEKRLRQILINLVSNAVKYTSVGGIEIVVGYRNHVADVKVSDTGIGIATDDIERIFEPFERGGSRDVQVQPGIGLGLAITRVLARVMGGDLDATSTLGEGSSFRLRLMLAPARATHDASFCDEGRISGYLGARRSVLIIDDDPAQSAVLQSVLRPLGFQVHVAMSGSEGLALAARCTPDLVLLDVQMTGMNGWDTRDTLRARLGGGLKIVMVSANVEELRSKSGDPAIPVISKPFDFATLLTVIATQLQLTWERTSTKPPRGEKASVEPRPDKARAFIEHSAILRRSSRLAGPSGRKPMSSAQFQPRPGASQTCEDLWQSSVVARSWTAFPTQAEDDEDKAKPTILVVDDTSESLGFLAQALGRARMNVLTASDGLAALDQLKLATPDLILMDAVMPRLDGFATTRRIKANSFLQQIPIIFMTGLTDTQDVVRGLDAGAVDFVGKPIVIDELLARIRVHLASARVAHGAQLALDTNSRPSLAVDGAGSPQWLTPAASEMLKRLFADWSPASGVLPSSFQLAIQRLEGIPPPPGTSFTLAAGESTVAVEFLRRTSANHWLFRLIERRVGEHERVLATRLGLTSREAEVLLWISRGKQNRQVSEILHISPRTVNKHLEQIFSKMGIENRASATAIAVAALAN